MLKIGNINIDMPFFQASLSGYSDYAMRKLANMFGVQLTFAGVMLAKSVANPKVIKKKEFRPFPDENMIGAQILGEDAPTMAKAAKALEAASYKIIDLNFACPAPKVLARQRGGFMLNKPGKVIEIYKAVRDTVTLPVTMKLRYGYDDSEMSKENFWQICETVVADGIDALIVHGRTAQQRFAGNANWEILTELKKRFPKTTIVGSGDLFDAETTISLMKTSNVDGVAIARGAIGNPWIFRELKCVLEGKSKPLPPDINEQKDVILKHFEMVCQLYPHNKSVRYFRKFAANYCKLHPSRRKVQRDLMAAKKTNELMEKINHWYK